MVAAPSDRREMRGVSVKGIKMKSQIKYIEHKPAEHTDRADAWIAHVWPSSSGKTLYFNNMALKKEIWRRRRNSF